MTDQHSLDRPDLTRKRFREGREHMTECEVREPSSPPDGGDLATDKLAAPAHPSNPLVAQLNGRWRVVDDPLQWVLQRRQGNARQKNTGWRCRSFCRTRMALLRCIHDYCGPVDPAALPTLKTLPDYHLDKESLDE